VWPIVQGSDEIINPVSVEILFFFFFRERSPNHTIVTVLFARRPAAFTNGGVVSDRTSRSYAGLTATLLFGPSVLLLGTDSSSRPWQGLPSVGGLGRGRHG